MPMPPVTDEHRRAAYALFAWRDCTYTEAMAHDLRRRLIEARAAHIRTQQWQRGHSQTTKLVRRIHPPTEQWRTQRVPGAWDGPAKLI